MKETGTHHIADAVRHRADTGERVEGKLRRHRNSHFIAKAVHLCPSHIGTIQTTCKGGRHQPGQMAKLLSQKGTDKAPQWCRISAQTWL